MAIDIPHSLESVKRVKKEGYPLLELQDLGLV